MEGCHSRVSVFCPPDHMSHEIQQIPAVLCMSVAVLSHPSVLDHPWQTTAKEAEPIKWLLM
jgi:hypothetical protein